MTDAAVDGGEQHDLQCSSEVSSSHFVQSLETCQYLQHFPASWVAAGSVVALLVTIFARESVAAALGAGRDVGR